MKRINMTIKNWYITGDTHRENTMRIFKLSSIAKNLPKAETALIILGDAGFNFYLNKTDRNYKRGINDLGYIIYCVRGNHEERPENLNMDIIYDPNVDGKIYIEKEFPNIRYFIDGTEYNINGLKTLVIGGAYSVDKYWRIEGAKPGQWTGWFPDEQLTPKEKDEIKKISAGKAYHMILSHTCPYSWRPTDLFLPNLDQSTVDSSMELWLESIKNNFTFDFWLFGHYHEDRLIRPNAEMFFLDIENLKDIADRHQYPNPQNACGWKRIDPKYFYED